jgi:hypothetical protein
LLWRLPTHAGKVRAHGRRSVRRVRSAAAALMAGSAKRRAKQANKHPTMLQRMLGLKI